MCRLASKLMAAPHVVCLCTQELKAELKELGQPLTGRKDELIDRLLAAQDGPASEAPEPEAGAPEPAKEAPGTTEPAPAPAKTDAPATSNGTHEPAAAPADAPKDGKRPRIVFNEDALKQVCGPARMLGRRGCPGQAEEFARRAFLQSLTLTYLVTDALADASQGDSRPPSRRTRDQDRGAEAQGARREVSWSTAYSPARHSHTALLLMGLWPLAV